jgi:hypothetical protein
MTYRDASIARLKGRWSANAEHPGIHEKLVSVKGIDTPVRLLSQILPDNPMQLQWHCVACTGNTLLGEGFAHRQAHAAHNAIHNMLGLTPAE